MADDEIKLTPEQNAAIDKLARKLLIVGEDRTAALVLMMNEYAKSVHAEHPDLSEDKIEDAAKRFGDLILRRFNELNSNVSGEGHA
jgi:hypothetical protein